MLERAISEVLGKFLQDVKEESVGISFREGKCVLRDCSLKKSAWEMMGLPFEVTSARFEVMEMKLDWSWTRFSSSAVVSLKGVSIDIQPFTNKDGGFCTEKAREAILAQKRIKLEQAIERYIQEQLSAANASRANKDTAGWLERFVGRLLKSAKVDVSDINVVYSDPLCLVGSGITRMILRAKRFSLQDDDAAKSDLICLSQDNDRLVSKNVTVSECSFSIDEDPEFPSQSQILQPTSFSLQLVFDPSSLAAEVNISSEPIQLSDISPDLIHDLVTVVSSWVFLEQFTHRKLFPILPAKPNLRLLWAANIVRKKLRQTRFWKTVPDVTKKKYLNALSYHDRPVWLARFESECPFDLLLKWRKEFANLTLDFTIQQHQLQQNQAMSSIGGWKEWLVSVAKEEQQEESLSASEEQEDPFNEANDNSDENAIRVFRIKIPKVETVLVDEHGFDVCSFAFGLSAALVETDSTKQVWFNLDSLSLIHNATASNGSKTNQIGILYVRKTLPSSLPPAGPLTNHGEKDPADQIQDREVCTNIPNNTDDTRLCSPLANQGSDEDMLSEFFDASNGVDISSKTENLMNASAPLRLRVDLKESILTDVSLVVEPVELLWEDEIILRVLHLTKNIYSVAMAAWPRSNQLTALADELVTVSESTHVPTVKVRFGAPSIAFLGRAGDGMVTTMLDFGHFSLDTTSPGHNDVKFDCTLHGVRFLTVDKLNRGTIFKFGNKTYSAVCAAGPVDINGTLIVSHSREGATFSTSLQVNDDGQDTSHGVSVVVSRSSFHAALDIFHALNTASSGWESLQGHQKQVVPSSPISFDSPPPSLAVQNYFGRLDFSVPRMRLFFRQDGDRNESCGLDIVSFTISSAQLELEFAKNGTFLYQELRVGEISVCEGFKGRFLLCPCSMNLTRSHEDTEWKIVFPCILEINWLPSLIAKVSSNVFDFTGQDEQLKSMSVMLQSTVALLDTPRNIRSDVSIQFQVDGIRCTMFKLKNPLCKLSLEKAVLKIALRPPREIAAEVFVCRLSLHDARPSAPSIYDDNTQQVFGPLESDSGKEPGQKMLKLAVHSQSIPKSSPSLTIDAEIGNVMACIWQPFLLELVDYSSSAVLDVLTHAAQSSFRSDSNSSNRKDTISVKSKFGKIFVHLPTSEHRQFPRAICSIQSIQIESISKQSVDLEYNISGIALVVEHARDRISPVLELKSLPLQIFQNQARHFSLSNISVQLDCSTLAAIIACLNNNIVSNTTVFDAILLHQMQQRDSAIYSRGKSLPVIMYWKDLLAAKSRPQETKVTLKQVEVCFTDAPLQVLVDELHLSSWTRLDPTLLDFDFRNNLQIQGVHTRWRDLPLIGSQGGLSIGTPNLQPCIESDVSHDLQFSANITHDAKERSLQLQISLDNLCMSLDADDLVDISAYVFQVERQVQEIPSPKQHSSEMNSEAMALQTQPAANLDKKIEIEVEIIGAQVFLLDIRERNRIATFAAQISAVGNATSSFMNGKRNVDEGTLHVDAVINRHHLTEEGTTTSHEGELLHDFGDIGMTMTQSMILHANNAAEVQQSAPRPQMVNQANPIIKPFTFSVAWNIPFNSSSHTQLVNVNQTSDIMCFLTKADISFLTRVGRRLQDRLSPPPWCVSKKTDDREGFSFLKAHGELNVVLFEQEPMGLKLGPCDESLAHNLSMEVRGYAKQCEERITRAVQPGDALVSVNGTSLVGMSQDQVKQTLRDAPWPRKIVFLTFKGTAQEPSDPLLFVPVVQHVWTCKNCFALQPLEKRSVFSTLICSFCQATHQDITVSAGVSPNQTQQLQLGSLQTVSAFENQRYYMLVGWSSTLLPGDPMQWTDPSGNLQVSLEQLGKLPSCETDGLVWRWKSNWSIDQSNGDSEGWVYSKDFSGLFGRKKAHRIAKPGDSVRQRRWVRQRILCSVNDLPHDNAVPEESLERDHFDFDLVGEEGPQKSDESEDSEESEENAWKSWQRTVAIDACSHRVCVTLVEEKWRTPLLRFYSNQGDVSAIKFLWHSSTFRMAGTVTFNADFYNPTVLNWEPVIERFVFAFEIQGLNMSDGKVDENQTVALTLLGMERMNINLSLETVEVLCLAMLGKEIDREETNHYERLSKEEEEMPLQAVLENHTGVNLFYQIEGLEDEKVTVEQGSTAPLRTLDSYYSWVTKHDDLRVNLFGGWKPISGLSLTQLGKMAYAVEVDDEDTRYQSSKYAKVIVNIVRQSTRRVMSIESPYAVENRSSLPLALRLVGKSSGTLLLGACNLGDTTPLPVTCDLEDRTLHLYLQRQNGDRHGHMMDLKQLKAGVKRACQANLAKSSVGEILVERNLAQLAPGVWAVIQTWSTVLEKCYTGTFQNEKRSHLEKDDSVGGSRRLLIGSNYSTHQVRLELLSGLKVTNKLPCVVQVRIRAKAVTSGEDQQAARILSSGEVWLVDFIEDPSRYEWSTRILSVDQTDGGWSLWANVIPVAASADASTHRMNFTIGNEVGELILLQTEVTESRVDGISVAHLCITQTWFFIDHTLLSLQAGIVRHGRVIRAIPNQSAIRTIIVCENQRWNPIGGWTAPSLHRDPDGWVFGNLSVHKKASGPLNNIDPPQGFFWAEPEWQGTTSNGEWLYSSDFESEAWSTSKGRLDMVRRRVWTRRCYPVNERDLGQEAESVTVIGNLETGDTGVSLRLGAGRWCKEIKISGSEDSHHFFVEVYEGHHDRTGPGKFVAMPLLVTVGLDHSIHVYSRFEIRCELKACDVLYISQCSQSVRSTEIPDINSESVIKVKGGESCKLYWSDPDESKRFIRIGRHLERLGSIYWSGPVDPSILDEFVLLLTKPRDFGRGLLQFKIEEQETSKMVVIRIGECMTPMYRIENRTLHPIACGQVCEYGQELWPIVIKDRRSCVFGWEEMTKSFQPLLFIRQLEPSFEGFGDTSSATVRKALRSGKEVIVDLHNDVGAFPKALPHETASLPKDDIAADLQVRVYSDGETKVISITHAWAVVEAPPLVAEQTLRSIRLELQGVSLSIVGRQRELLITHLIGLAGSASNCRISSSLSMSIDKVQIDDPNLRTKFPVVFQPSDQTNIPPFINFHSSWYSVQAERHYRAKLISFQIGDFTVNLGRTLVRTLSRFGTRASFRIKRAQLALGTKEDHTGRKQPYGHDSRSKDHFYFDAIHLGPLSFRLTLSPFDLVSSGGTGFLHNNSFIMDMDDAEEVEELAKHSGTGQSVSAINVLAAAISRVTELGDSSLKLPYWALAVDHLLRGELRNQRVRVKAISLHHVVMDNLSSNAISQHYRFQLGTELASTAFVTSEMLDKPVNVIRTISKRLGTIWQSESQSVPTSLGRSARDLVGGTAVLSEGLFRGLAKGLATMSMSNEYIIRRRQLHDEMNGRRESLSGVLSQGMTFVKDGVTEGFVGLVTEPYRGARSRGAVGLIGGLGKGVVGAAIKPVMGVIDAATLASQAVQSPEIDSNGKHSLDTANPTSGSAESDILSLEELNSQLSGRLRLPRALVGRERLMRPYGYLDAEAQAVASRFGFHLESQFGFHRYKTASGSQDELFLVTGQRIVCISLVEDTLAWNLRLAELETATVRPMDADLSLFAVHLAAGQSSRVVRCGKDKKTAMDFLKVIDEAIRAQEFSDLAI